MSNKSAQKVSEEALSFLRHHRLEATPANYALAYGIHGGMAEALHVDTMKIIDDGFRMTQDQANELVLKYMPEMNGLADAPDERAELQRQAMHLAGLMKTSQNSASRFGADLAHGIETVSKGEAFDVMVIMQEMAERTSTLEKELADQSRKMDDMRQDLEAARTDAKRDALTNLPNRRATDEFIARINKSGDEYAVAIVDIDHFKSVNDRFGHAVGDRVLKGVADLLAENCGKFAHVARWGGEEFILVFLASEIAKSHEIVDQARALLAEKQFKLRETDEPLGQITFSAGIASGKEDAGVLSVQADERLYRAKNSGRNKVISDDQ